MLNIKTISVTMILLVLGGCATGAKVENMSTEPVSVEQKQAFDEQLKSQIAISETTGGKKTNPLWVSSISNEAFQEAVIQSLKANDLYSETGSYTLNIELQKVKQPIVGISMTVTTTVRYVLSDQANDRVLLDEVIVSPHTAKISDAFVGVTRLRLANEGSAKKNIEGLIEKIAKLKLDGVDVSN